MSILPAGKSIRLEDVLTFIAEFVFFSLLLLGGVWAGAVFG